MAERKTRAVSRRATAKKTTGKKQLKRNAVTVAKNVTKKAIKKAIDNNQKSEVKITKKEVKESTKKIDSKVKSNKFLSNEAKLEHKDEIKNTKPKNKTKEAVLLDTSHKVAIKDDTVTIFSRVRTENTVMLVARVLGVAFVIVGAIFALIGVGSTNDVGYVSKVVKKLENNLIASLTSSVTTGVIADTTSASSTQTKTEPVIRIDMPSEPVSGSVELNFNTTFVSKVFLRLHSKDTGAVLSLGGAVTTDGTLWKYMLDTTKFRDGEYALAVHVTDASGAYVKTNLEKLVINNSVVLSNDNNDDNTDTIEANNINSSSTVDLDNDEEVGQFREYEENKEDESLAVTKTSPTTNLINSDFTKSRSKIITNFDNPVSGFVTITAESTGAQFAEFYVRQNDSLRDMFIGLGRESLPGTWKLYWDTKQIPNGEYKVIVKHKNSFGFYWSDFTSVVIKNYIAFEPTEAEKKVVDTINDANKEVNNPLAEFNKALNRVADNETATTSVETNDKEVKSLESSFNALRDYKSDIETVIQTYTLALRHDDDIKRQDALARIEELEKKIVFDSIGDSSISNHDDFENNIEARFDRLVADVESSEQLIRERIGEAATKDSDSDGVTDYDEMTLYKTNPFSADSDGDGFTDEAEILGGFNPTSDVQESAIIFESPKETGVVREDILVVENIVVENPEINTETKDNPVAILSGRALPNSFVTIYIFSTPIIITVKTEADGSWNYRFDKELEDGEHQVFVGVTDNAGKIVAKSNPFTFIKEAEAFSPVGAETNAGIITSEPSQPSLLNKSTLLVAAGGIVVALGLILLLMTLYLHSRREENISMAHAQ